MEQGQIHFLVEGRVQGVGFRAFVQSEASRLGLVGWVRNLSDGRVEGVAQGLQDRLQLLEEKIRQGPSFSKVVKAEFEKIEDEEVQIKEFNFRIASTGDRPWQK